MLENSSVALTCRFGAPGRGRVWEGEGETFIRVNTQPTHKRVRKSVKYMAYI